MSVNTQFEDERVLLIQAIRNLGAIAQECDDLTMQENALRVLAQAAGTYVHKFLVGADPMALEEALREIILGVENLKE